MKQLLSALILMIAGMSGYGQNVGIGTNTPDSSALLELKSTTSGLLPPRMTYAQRNFISNPAIGLIIYCIDCGNNGGEPQYFNGAKWLNMSGGISQLPPQYNLPYVLIGNLAWSKTNLSVAKYRNGDIIPQVTDPTEWRNQTSGAWCWYNNDSAVYGSKYGRLYNWFAVNDPRGLAPEGWHVPSNAEWNILFKFLDPNADTTCNNCLISIIASSGMMSTTGWGNPVGGNNNSGLTALPGGSRYNPSTFQSAGSQGYWWSSSASSEGGGSFYILQNVQNYLRKGGFYKNFGYSVRVVRD